MFSNMTPQLSIKKEVERHETLSAAEREKKRGGDGLRRVRECYLH